jgi:protease-4
MLLLSGCIHVNVSVMQPLKPFKELVIEGKGRSKILLMSIAGFIAEKEKSDRLELQKTPSLVSEVREALQKAGEDPDIAGVILKINSPGGTVAASDIIHHELMHFREKKQVPLYACITGLGTSGAYYIATAADRIFSHPNAITGSIGVIAFKFNIEGLMTKIGVQDETIKSGEKKDLFSPFRPLTFEERKILQEVIDGLHARFIDVVYARRKEAIDRSGLESLADGRIYTASTALESRLIDHIAYMDDVISEMKGSLGLKDAKIVSYQRTGEYAGTIYSSYPAHDSSLTDLLGSYADGRSPLPGVAFLYLWNP